MTSQPIHEMQIDLSLDSYIEGRVLDIALEYASSEEERSLVEQLKTLRTQLEEQRKEYFTAVTRLRHARGEIYSDAKVKAINAMMPKQAELEKSVQEYYARNQEAKNVLAAYARSVFPFTRVNKKSTMAELPSDAKALAMQMFEEEEAFMATWIEAIADTALTAQLHARERELHAMFRTSNRPMALVAKPHCPMVEKIDANVLGKAWNKLDSLCDALQIKPLSAFIGIEGQSDEDSAHANELLETVASLITASESAECKLPAKKATREALLILYDVLTWLVDHHGRVYFEVDY